MVILRQCAPNHNGPSTYTRDFSSLSTKREWKLVSLSNVAVMNRLTVKKKKEETHLENRSLKVNITKICIK